MLFSFTQAVIREMCLPENQAETVLACREWRQEHPNDPERCAVEFAGQLDEDFKAMWLVEGFLGEVMKLALMRVNWRMVAEVLLDRFAPLPATEPEPQPVIFNALRIPSLN